MTDIFISYSSKDKVVANTICAKLEQEQMKCWIAPRDISPGEEWASGIVRGIDNAKCIVVVFSESANNSKHVLREIERAVDKNIIVIPFKIDEVMPSDSMEFFLKVAHWLEAHDQGLENGIDKLKATIAAILERPIPPQKSQPVTSITKLQKNNNTILIAALAVVAIVGGIGWLQMGSAPVVEPVVNPKPVTSNALDKYIQANETLLNIDSLNNLKSTNTISKNLPNHNIAMKTWVTPESKTFYEGEKLTFKVSMDESAYLLAYVHSVDGSSYLIYPNKFAKAQLIEKDTTFSLGQNGPFELEVSEPFGVDVVQFIATTDRKEFLDLLSKHNEINGTTLSIIDRSVLVKESAEVKKRGIKIVKSQTSDKQKSILGQWGESFVILNTKARD